MEAVAAKTIRVAKQETENNISDIFTKSMKASRIRFLLEKFTYYDWHIPEKGKDNPQMFFSL